MSEHAKLPGGVRSWSIWRRPASALGPAVDHIEGGPLPELAEDVIPVSDLPAFLAQRDQEWRDGLLGDEAKEAAADAHELRCAQLHAPTHRETAQVVLQAAIDKAAPDGGGGE